MLHGYGSNEADLFMLASDLPPQYYPVSIRAPYTTPFGGYAWFALYTGPDLNITADRDQMLDTAKHLDAFIQQLAAGQGWTASPVLLGFSQGGMMAYRLSLYSPHDYSRAAVLSSKLPVEELPPVSFERARQLQFYVSHGLYDDVIPVDEARRSVQWLRHQGIAVDYHEYPSGHFLTGANINDLSAWLARHVPPADQEVRNT